MSVRVRFAPSPTGPLHIGGVRTALYNYLFARKMGGKMLLRIEDTDQTRFVPGATDYIQEALQWLGIEIDEGVGVGGDAGPYVQSERKDIYAKYAQQLLDEGKAYYAFDTPEELDQMRKELEAAKVDNISYNAFTRMKMKNSITLPAEEVEERISSGQPYVIRLKVPLKDEVRFKDLVRGWVSVHSSTIDDKVLMKSDGMPTYHLANIVDDHMMGITHVIRGEEWLPSAPLHILLYKAFGWQAPEFAHLPLLLKPEGNGKLSKRDGLLGDFPVFPLEWKDPNTAEISRGFREDGYYPEAVMNFLALLGWNPGNDQEILSKEELISLFDIHNIQKAGARFDVQKAKWFNQQYLRKKDNAVLADELKASLPQPEWAEKIVALMKDRVDFVKEMTQGVTFLFASPDTYEEEVAAKKWDDLAKQAMPVIISTLEGVSNFQSQDLHDALFSGLEAASIKPGKVMQALRLAVTGQGKGPDLMLIMEIIGKEETLKRLNKALDVLGR
ncbi:glutamate--tRNA ligase [Leadbetterella byssophila]|uniref:Glutamate--tRNA ligase n=1 Tax=Leadbetterella byssophila (strain DSM 17132 / JCM 16389 / KACC 11308 / NBRC 106382 / 4M15) TaxID=649349 RepID=E4RWT4_LEAB4|nr:glutamate--tRNA ligase [Leadbetterella byssophila]ADQ16253.1 glutamyl-tRNA synthetase [Leadbetterella byssophila DSM 17132]